MTKKTFLSIATALSATLVTCPPAVARDAASTTAVAPVAETVLPDDVQWGPLNAARGEASPRAGNLWGDRTTPGASGFLVKFDEGFASPPHIHNVTYRGLVIEGLVHNDDPAAADMWLPAGSYWTQPAGESHITSAKGKANLAYIEIEDGPYLVRPSDKAFDDGERPINVHESNIVWLDASDINWLEKSASATVGKNPRLAFLWGSPEQGELRGALVKLPPGFSGTLQGNISPLRAVVIKGQIGHGLTQDSEKKALPPGSYFGSTVAAVHEITNMSDKDSIIYIRSNGPFTIE
ncbi:DUF4437 domain-containing protein [Sphingorhabdus sp. SMR4y]|uniref:DUF4437 domain-containing protein n=1 Tax=Sphingorhabdus sp. SMR4y TaxID=2584094 RepID=UPI000B5C485B|nr:DUF4437 domain-containing protein [Sphingorhabdus sp. SMR4y]ASK87958.1 hypothetical protein SPHFLASMR4Y_01192 [Sphingorhabdus sp. SMR4y]